VILGLYISEKTPLMKKEREKVGQISTFIENFMSNEGFHSKSSITEQLSGASQFYRWGLPEKHADVEEDDDESSDDEESTSKGKCLSWKTTSRKKKKIECEEKSKTELCRRCDITMNNDIDKYILKSSVPACPDMKDYALKSMITTCPDMNDYILKSEIKPCEKVDLSGYIKKSEIPSCPECPVCPKCPICPICPKPQPCKQIHQYKITEHPDLKKYVSNEKYKDLQNQFNEYKEKYNKNWRRDSDENDDDEDSEYEEEDDVIDNIRRVKDKIKSKIKKKVNRTIQDIKTKLQGEEDSEDENHDDEDEDSDSDEDSDEDSDDEKEGGRREKKGSSSNRDCNQWYIEKEKKKLKDVQGYYVGDSAYASV
jgi:hypothetical protein